MRAFRFLAAFVLAASLFGVGMVANAATSQTVTTRHGLDPAFCRALNDGARNFVAAHPGSTDPTVAMFRQGLQVATDTNCFATDQVQTTQPEAAMVSRLLGSITASANGCWQGWPSQNYYWAGYIYVGYTYIGFGDCWVTNQLVSAWWGPDGGGSFIGPYKFTKDWTGWASPNPANPLVAGMNFHVQACLPFCGPAYWGDQRDALYNNGALYQYY